MSENHLMSEKLDKVFRALNYFQHLIVFTFAFSGCV